MSKFKRITDAVMTAMESPTRWQQTWRSQPGLHRNLDTGHIYRGSNQLMCMISQAVHGYESPYWVTAGYCIKNEVSFKGCKSTPIIYYGQKEKEEGNPDTLYKFSKVTNLFHVEQVDIEPPTLPKRDTAVSSDLPAALQVQVADGSPSYSPALDQIKMPIAEYFNTDEAYLSTLWHECAHSTGHKKRLDRDLTHGFGSEGYAKEELIAELAAIFICAEHGIDYDLQGHANYLASWSKAIKDSDSYFLQAATAAQKVCDYCMSQLDLMRQQEDAA